MLRAQWLVLMQLGILWSLFSMSDPFPFQAFLAPSSVPKPRPSSTDYFESKACCWLVQESSGMDVYYGVWKKIPGKNRFHVFWDEGEGECELEFTLKNNHIELKQVTKGCDSASRYTGKIDRQEGAMEGYAYFRKEDGSEWKGHWNADVLGESQCVR